MSCGKKFEAIFREQVSAMSNIYCLRLYDTVGYAGVYQPCDFICYSKYFYMCELKTTALASLPFTNISENQFKSLLDASKKVKNLIAYVIVWFYNKDVTKAFSIEYLNKLKSKGKKSVRYDDKKGITVYGIKKRKYFIYDWERLFKGAHNESK